MNALLQATIRTLRPRWAEKQDRVARFRQVILAAREVAAINKFALPTLLRSVARPLQARRLNVALQHQHDACVSADFDDMLFPPHRPISADGRSLAELTRCRNEPTDRAYIRLRLNRDVILPWAWSRCRLVGTLSTIGEAKTGGAWRWDVNHRVQLVLPLGLGFVLGGNHSIVAGIADGEGEVFAEPLDICGAYEHVYYDGCAFKRLHDDVMLNAPRDEETGTLFEIGRLMHELDVPYDATSVDPEERQRAVEPNRHEILYQVWVDDRDTGMSMRSGTVHAVMQRAGVLPTSRQWHDTLYSSAPFSPDGRTVYTFRPYGPRPLATGIEHQRWSRAES